MKISFIKRSILFAVFMSLLCMSHAQTPHASFKFANSAGYDFAILLFGAEKGEATLDWGNGQTQTITIEPQKGSYIKGKTLSEELTISGKISAIECSGNEMTDIDVKSLPMLSAFISRKNFTKNIDFSGNPVLKLLCIENSFLENLDLTHNVELDTLLLTGNKIETLKLPQSASKLKVLDCSSNFKLANLDLSRCQNLIRLQAHQTSITKFPLSNHRHLRYLSAGLMRPITQLDLPNNNVIDTLFLPAAGLKSIDLSGCNELKVLVVDNNYSLGNINCSNLTKLVSLDCIGTAISSLDVSNCKNLEVLNCNNCALESLDLSNNKKLKVLACFENALTKLTISNTILENLDCSYNGELKNLTLPPTVKDLNCSACGLKELTFANPAIMESLVCSENEISRLDVSQMTELSALTCNDNKIETLNTGKLNKLLNINVAANPITSLNMSASPGLSYVKIDGSQLDACALNGLYRSLRAIDKASQSTGVYYVENNVPDASISATSIATDKGWTVTVPGDGSGCPASINNIEQANNAISVCFNGAGWTVTGLPVQAKAIKLYNMNGSPVGSYRCTSSLANIPSSVESGIYVIVTNGVARTILLKK